jgi:hypothetical protein
MTMHMLIGLVLLMLASWSAPASAQDHDGYQVTALDIRTRQWTLVRRWTRDGHVHRKRMVVVCEFLSEGEPSRTIKGPRACTLSIGQRIVSNRNPKDGAPPQDIRELSSTRLAIIKGIRSERVVQQFEILEQESIEPARAESPAPDVHAVDGGVR